MKLHITHHIRDSPHKKTYALEVNPAIVYGKRINDDIDLSELDLRVIPQDRYRLVVRGMSGIDGTPARHDVGGLVPRKLWNPRSKRYTRYRPNLVDEKIVVVDAVLQPLPIRHPHIHHDAR